MQVEAFRWSPRGMTTVDDVLRSVYGPQRRPRDRSDADGHESSTRDGGARYTSRLERRRRPSITRGYGGGVRHDRNDGEVPLRGRDARGRAGQGHDRGVVGQRRPQPARGPGHPSHARSPSARASRSRSPSRRSRWSRSCTSRGRWARSLRSGVPVPRHIENLRQDTKNKRFAAVLGDVVERVGGGWSLTEASDGTPTCSPRTSWRCSARPSSPVKMDEAFDQLQRYIRRDLELTRARCARRSSTR